MPSISSSSGTGPLKCGRVRGIACNIASACWTETELFTWGKNNGQLGYDKTASLTMQPEGRLKIVTKITKAVISVTGNVCMTVLLMY